MSEKLPTTVVLGVGADGKPHASRFQERDAPFVARAAALMGFHVITVSPDNDELHGIAAALPLGKIYATGRAFVPFVSRGRFDKLGTLVEGGVTIAQRSESGAASVYPKADMFTTDTINTADTLWSKIDVGMVVLATQPEVYGPGWWEGIVVGIEGDNLKVRWLDEPDEDGIKVPRREVALRHPGVD